jgi:hypothetical protein
MNDIRTIKHLADEHNKNNGGTHAREKAWCKAHKNVRITNEAYHVLIMYAGRLQAETGEIMGISEALIEVIRRVGEPDFNSSLVKMDGGDR